VVSDPSRPALVLRADPLRATRQVPAAIAVGWLAGAGVVLIAVTSALAARLR
jgi:hypothetical protein